MARRGAYRLSGIFAGRAGRGVFIHKQNNVANFAYIHDLDFDPGPTLSNNDL